MPDSRITRSLEVRAPETLATGVSTSDPLATKAWTGTAEPAAQQQVAGYEILGELGRGGMHSGEDPFALSTALLNLGWLLADMLQNEAAAKLMEECVELRLACRGPADRDTAVARVGLAAVYINDQKFLQAIPPYQQAMATLRKIEGAEGLAESIDLFQKGLIGDKLPALARSTLLGLRDDEAVERCFEQSVQLARESLGKDHGFLGLVLYEQGRLLASHKKLSQAETCYRECLRICRLYGLEHPKQTHVVLSVSLFLYGAGKQGEARQLLEESLASLQDSHPAGHRCIVELKLMQAALTDAGPAGWRRRKVHEALAMYDRIPAAPYDFVARGIGSIISHSQAAEIVDLACELASAATQRRIGKQTFQDVAMIALVQAKKKGFHDAQRLLHDKELTSLRERDDFKELVADMQSASER